MDCYKQIAEIKTAEDEERVRSSLEDNYGKVPVEVDNLILIAKLKVAARKHNAVKISLSGKRAEIVLNGIDSLKEEGFLDRINSRKNVVTPAFRENPALEFAIRETPRDTAEEMLDFFDF